MRYLVLAAGFLAGCNAPPPDGVAHPPSAERFTGKRSVALIYIEQENGTFSFACSGAYVTPEGGPAKGPGVLTASHCFSDVDPSTRGFYASFDGGEHFLKLGRAWVGDRFKGADISFVELEAQASGGSGLPTPMVVPVRASGIAEGDQVWTWANADNKGVALAVGYVMNAAYKEKPIEGTLGSEKVMVDLHGYHVADINTSPGSSGGVMMTAGGAVVGVLSSDYRHESGFKITFVTPIERLSSVLSQPPSNNPLGNTPGPGKP